MLKPNQLETIKNGGGISQVSIYTPYTGLVSSSGILSLSLPAPISDGNLKFIQLTMGPGTASVTTDNIQGSFVTPIIPFTNVGDYLILVSAGGQWCWLAGIMGGIPYSPTPIQAVDVPAISDPTIATVTISTSTVLSTGNTYTDAAVKTAVNGAVDTAVNAALATERTHINTALSTLNTQISAILTALKNATLMG